jgi:hypothetical protein
LLPLAATTGIETLRITDLVLRPSPERLPLPDFPNDIGFLIFEELHDFRVIDEIIRLLNDPYDISLTSCTLGDATDGFWHFGDGEGIRGALTLAQMMNQDMAPLLRLWNGRDLDIIGCPSFNDVVLHLMSSMEGGAFICAKYVQQLSIQNCPNFSISALQQLVESRLDYPNDYHYHSLTPTKFDSISLQGNVPSVSQEDRAWFVGNVDIFTVHY